MIKIDESKEKFEIFKVKFEEYKKNDLTETDTRSKLLDELFKTVLGWDESDIEREGYVQNEGFFDYRFSIPGFHFIVEAKKNFIEFKMPAKHNVVTIGTLKQQNEDVISQVRRYLVEIGLQYGVVSNGHQFIIGKFVNTGGEDWKKNKCLIFDGIKDIENRFIDFYNCLSKYSIIENGGFEFLTEDISKGNIILSSIPNYDSEIVRNDLSSKLNPVLNQVFGEIYKYEYLDNKKLIEECFVENDEIKKNKEDIEKLFADRPLRLGEVSQARNTKNISKQIQEEFDAFPNSFWSEPPNPIIVVGSKGAGKTTFINYLFKLSFDDDFLKNRPYINIDFRKYTNENLDKINQLIIKDSLEYIYTNYSELNLHSRKVLMRIYKNDIKRNDEGVWENDKKNNPDKYQDKIDYFLEKNIEDFESHFVRLSEYLLRERSMRLCLVLDNADQFDISYQKKAFLFAQSINRKAKCAVIISLREGYYYHWRSQPPFDAFSSNVYHVTAPPYKEVLQKRIDYAIENIAIEGKTSGAFGSLSFEISNDAVKDFMLSVKKSLFGSKNDNMLAFLEKTTYPNIREGLELFKQFLLSGHTQVSEYVIRQVVTPDALNPIPFWEFLKATALENKKYYNHTKSKVHNIFYPSQGNTNHFIKYKILRYLLKKAESQGFSEKYIIVGDIVNIFASFGYKVNSVIDELSELLSLRLIESEDVVTDKENLVKLEDLQNICISLKGSYYIDSLVCEFSYIDLIMQDTPIYDFDIYSSIRQVFPLDDGKGNRYMPKRLDAVLMFIQYLQNEDKKESIESRTVVKNVIQEILNNGLNDELKSVEQIVKRIHRPL